MRVALLAAAVACFALPVHSASLVARQEGDSIRIYDKPCHAEVVRAIPETKDMGAAMALVGGKQYKACWESRGPVIFIRYEDGDAGVIPAQLFKEEVGI
jgi:hypothetical protein